MKTFFMTIAGDYRLMNVDDKYTLYKGKELCARYTDSEIAHEALENTAFEYPNANPFYLQVGFVDIEDSEMEAIQKVVTVVHDTLSPILHRACINFYGVNTPSHTAGDWEVLERDTFRHLYKAFPIMQCSRYDEDDTDMTDEAYEYLNGMFTTAEINVEITPLDKSYWQLKGRYRPLEYICISFNDGWEMRQVQDTLKSTEVDENVNYDTYYITELEGRQVYKWGDKNSPHYEDVLRQYGYEAYFYSDVPDAPDWVHSTTLAVREDKVLQTISHMQFKGFKGNICYAKPDIIERRYGIKNRKI
jgi:hypothetical protein